MTAQGGMGDNLYIDGYDPSADINSLASISSPIATLPFHGIDKSAMQRQHGKRDGHIEFLNYFNDGAGEVFTILKTLTRNDRILTYCRGTSIGSASASMVAKQVSFDPTRDEDGGLLFTTVAEANRYGLEWGKLLTAGKRTDTSATNGAELDLGSVSPGAFGGQMFVHLFAFTGTSVTIKVQESSASGGGGDAFADVVGATSGAISSVQALRVATGAINIERYLRVVTTGTFSNAIFAVHFLRNKELPVF